MSDGDKRIPMHQCAPKLWRRIPSVTGSYELDGAIARCTNTDAHKRLEFYTARDTYGPRTGYDGYSGYSGDD